MADDKPGVTVRTEDGHVAHREATDWRVDPDNNLDIYNGDDQIGTYRNGFWYYVGRSNDQRPA